MYHYQFSIIKYKPKFTYQIFWGETNDAFFFKNISLLNNSGFKRVLFAVKRFPASLNNLSLGVEVAGLKCLTNLIMITIYRRINFPKQ